MGRSDSIPDRVGRYEVKSLLGQGAMGRVLAAHDPMLDRDVAIKMLRPDLDIGLDVRDGLLTRMRQEAKAVARVAHPNIVTLHDMIDDADLGLCLVFEHVNGRTLSERIKDGPMPPVEVARVAREIGSALSVAHRAGVLHRDIKPDNIMLAEHGAKITDFGIARLPDSTLTRAGGLLGTPAYSAPECISDAAFSPASDQFSLATTLYEAISAQRAFPGEDAVTVAARIGTEEPKPIAQRLGLDPRVDQILGRGLSKASARRFAECEAFGEALAAALEIGTLHDATTTLVDVPRGALGQPPRTRWPNVGLGTLALAALSVLIGISIWHNPTANTAPVSSALRFGPIELAAPSSRLSGRSHSRVEPPVSNSVDITRDAGGDAGERSTRDGGGNGISEAGPASLPSAAR